MNPLNPLGPYLLWFKAGAVIAILAGMFWWGHNTASEKCAAGKAQETVAAQSQALESAGKADTAASARETAAITRRAALEGARQALKEAKPDACIDAVAGADVLSVLATPAP